MGWQDYPIHPHETSYEDYFCEFEKVYEEDCENCEDIGSCDNCPYITSN